MRGRGLQAGRITLKYYKIVVERSDKRCRTKISEVKLFKQLCHEITYLFQSLVSLGRLFGQSNTGIRDV